MHTELDMRRLEFGEAIRNGDVRRAYRISCRIAFLCKRDGVTA
jgi:hypothetical protein